MKGPKNWAFKVDDPAAPLGIRKQLHRSGFATMNEADAALDALLGQRRQLRAAEGPAAVVDATLGEYMTAWLARRNGGLAVTTQARYLELVERHVVGCSIGSKRVRDLGPGDFDGFRDELGQRPGRGGRPLSEHTKRHVLALVKTALTQLVDREDLDRHPMRGVPLPAAGGIPRDAWTPGELQEFVAWLMGSRGAHAHEMEAIVLMAVLTGMRRGEILGLRWRDVDLEARTARVVWNRVSVANKVHEKPPKSAKSRRQVALSPATCAVLAGVSDRQRRAYEQLVAVGREPAEYPEHVFTDEFLRPIHPDYVRQRWVRLMKASPVKVITFHGLRHTYATIALAEGEHPKVVSEQLGHADVAFTLRQYGHVMPGMARDSVDRIALRMFGDDFGKATSPDAGTTSAKHADRDGGCEPAGQDHPGSPGGGEPLDGVV